MAPQATITRRRFLRRSAGTAGALAAAPYVITSTALGAEGRPPASGRIVMGGIGIGNQGGGDLGAFLGRKDVQYVAVCDAKRGVRQDAKGKVDQRYGNKDCQAYSDFGELLARDDIDAVHVATPDHWHAVIVIEACRQGKDVYCQKPETLTLDQGPAMVAAARKYGRVVSGGSQRVLEDYRKVVDQCWGGELGTIKSINVEVGPLPRPCNLPGKDVPEGFDWDMWLGPAPWAPYHPYRCSGSYSIDGTSWRSWSDYSGGGMTDWGAHHFGGATFAIDVRELEPEEVIFHNENGKKFATCRYPNGKLLHHNYPGRGNLDVEGTNEQGPSKPVPGYAGSGGIYGDFIDCIKTREKPFRDIELASHTAAVCHLGNIAYELQRSLKWDQAKQEFPGDDEANRMTWRPMREPWRV